MFFNSKSKRKLFIHGLEISLIVFNLLLLTFLVRCEKKKDFKSNVLPENAGIQIIYVAGKRNQIVKGCSACESNKNSDGWKALHSVFYNNSQVKLILRLSAKADQKLFLLPYDYLEILSVEEPDDDIFLVVKD